MRKEIGMIGLGKFGLNAALTLKELGHRVVALEKDEGLVQRYSHDFDAVFSGDATDKSVLDQLRFQDLDQVIVSVGNSMEPSIMVVLNLQELRLDDQKLIVKAANERHAMVLERLGVSQVIQPEVETARQLAHQINNPGLLDFLSLGGGLMLQKVMVKKWAGRSLIDLKLPAEQRIMVVAEKDDGDRDFRFAPDPTPPLKEGTELLVIGPAANILKLEP